MFLVEDRRNGATNLVFTWKNPRGDGFTGDVVEGVSLDYDMDAVHRWPEGADQPDACVGRAADDPKQYKVFKYRSELHAAGYRPLAGTPVVVGSWPDYLRLLHPESLDEEEWFALMDKLDEASRRRRQGIPAPDAPAGTGRDEVAAWVAKNHRIVDSGIREIWYLPQGAPPDEIRLLELNDRLGGGEPTTEPLGFGLEVNGARFHLKIADVTSEELEEIRRDPARLPPGWSLDGAAVWRRGA